MLGESSANVSPRPLACARFARASFACDVLATGSTGSQTLTAPAPFVTVSSRNPLLVWSIFVAVTTTGDFVPGVRLKEVPALVSVWLIWEMPLSASCTVTSIAFGGPGRVIVSTQIGAVESCGGAAGASAPHVEL